MAKPHHDQHPGKGNEDINEKLLSKTFGDDLLDAILCAICLEVFDDPVILPCRHSLCRACAIRTIDSQSILCCPYDRISHRIQVKDLISNFQLNQIVLAMKKRTDSLTNISSISSTHSEVSSSMSTDHPSWRLCVTCKVLVSVSDKMHSSHELITQEQRKTFGEELERKWLTALRQCKSTAAEKVKRSADEERALSDREEDILRRIEASEKRACEFVKDQAKFLRGEVSRLSAGQRSVVKQNFDGVQNSLSLLDQMEASDVGDCLIKRLEDMECLLDMQRNWLPSIRLQKWNSRISFHESHLAAKAFSLGELNTVFISQVFEQNGYFSQILLACYQSEVDWKLQVESLLEHATIHKPSCIGISFRSGKCSSDDEADGENFESKRFGSVSQSIGPWLSQTTMKELLGDFVFVQLVSASEQENSGQSKWQDELAAVAELFNKCCKMTAT